MFFAFVAVAVPVKAQTSGTWNTNASGNWSSTNNWLGGLVANGAGATANLTFDITAATTVSIDTAVTLGALNIGDASTNYTLALSTGSLAFDNNGSGATISMTAGSAAGQSISASFSLNDNLTINDTTTRDLTLSGNISNGSNGAKSVTISSSGTGRINASGANTFSGGLYVNSGYYYGQTSASAFGGSGTGAVYMGNTSGTSSATLRGDGRTFANPITVRSGSSNNTLTIMGVGGGGTTTFSGGVTLNRDVVFDLNNGGLVFSSAGLSGSGSVTVTNVGNNTNIRTMDLNAAGAGFTGGLTVVSGTNNNTTLRVSNAGALNSNNTVKVSSGLFELNNVNQTIAGLNDNAGAGGAVSVSTNAGRTLTLGGAGSYSFNGTLRDNTNGTAVLSVTKSGVGVQGLGGTNTYTGTTTVSGGVLRLDSASALPGGIGSTGGTSALVLSGGVIGLASGDFSRNIVGLTPGATDVGWLANGSGGFAAFGADRSVNFGGAGAGVTWSASGGVFGSNLILSDASADAMVTVVNPINFSSGARTVTVNNGSAAVDATLAGSLTGGGTLNKQGSGVLALTASNSIGTFNINAGTLRASHTNAFGASTSATLVQVVNGAMLELDASVSAGSGLSGAGTVMAVNGSRTLTLRELSGNSQTFSGILQDGGSGVLSLSKIGAGTQILSGNNTYSGATTVSAGTLVVNGDSSSATGAWSVASGAALSGSGIIGGATAVSGILSPGNSPGALTFSGNLTLNSTAETIMEIGGTSPGSGYDRISVGGALAYSGALSITNWNGFDLTQPGAYDLFDFASYSGDLKSVSVSGLGLGWDSLDTWIGTNGTTVWTFTENDGILTAALVPEPSTWSLLLAGTAWTWVVLRRRRKSR